MPYDEETVELMTTGEDPALSLRKQSGKIGHTRKPSPRRVWPIYAEVLMMLEGSVRVSRKDIPSEWEGDRKAVSSR